MLAHTKVVKPYECDICKKKFSQKVNLVEHFTIHSGEKTYDCVKCGKWYTHNSSRIKHISTHHNALCSELKCI